MSVVTWERRGHEDWDENTESSVGVEQGGRGSGDGVDGIMIGIASSGLAMATGTLSVEIKRKGDG